ncbi:MAG: uroporphyrinogen decarboxylase family protein [Sphaerochaetaceae bacterium]
MKTDVVALSKGITTAKILSKETLNHRLLLYEASGIDPVINTPKAFKEAYYALGIDFINRVPVENCSKPLDAGESRVFDDHYMVSSLGVYDTYYRYRYPYASVDDFLKRNETEVLDYHSLRTPVPHPLDLLDIRKRENTIGEIGCYYCQLYTTLFMWGLEHLGWEVFMMSIALDPDYLDRYFLDPAFYQTKELAKVLVESDSPYLFFHDDVATAQSLSCQKEWMVRYLFPRYKELWNFVHAQGKKIVFVCDGNIESILEDIRDTGVDGVMLENPANSLESIVDVFSDKLIIGGIDTNILSNGTPSQVAEHVHSTLRLLEGRTFALSSCGGLHDGIPMRNLETYFDIRAEYGINIKEWRATDR